MKYAYILAIIFAICVVLTLSQPTEFDEELPPYVEFEELPYQEGEEDVFEFLDQVQTQQQFLATFDPADYEQDMLIADEIKASDSFKTRREANIVIQHGLTVEEYDELHGFALASLIELTDLLKIQYNPYTTTYGDIMYLIDLHISRSTPEIQSEALALLMDIRPYSHLFAGRFSLLPAEDEDAVLQAIVHLDGAVNWLVNKVKSNKCTFCLKIVGYVRKRACGAAGNAVCSLIVKPAGVFSGALQKWGCGKPINFASKLGGWCDRGLKFLLRNTRASDRNICRNVHLPTLSWRTHSNAFYKITGKTINFGNAC